MKDPRTLFVAPRDHVREYIESTLMREIAGANVTLYQRPGDAHYGDLGERNEQHVHNLLRRSSHICAIVESAQGPDLALLRRLFGWQKPLGLMVKSPDPDVYDKLGRMHRKHPRFKVVVAIGGPNGVERAFYREHGPRICVFTPFDLEHKPWLLMMDVFHKLWN